MRVPARPGFWSRAAMVAASVVSAGCASAESDIALVVANRGAEPLRCLVVFGHWVTADVPVFGPGASATVTLRRDSVEHSLFVPRSSDGRRMMVEDLACDRDAAWGQSLVHVGLDPVRQGTGTRYEVACDLDGGAGCGAPTEP